MRFILEFIIFGLIFYALYLYAPDLFAMLVSWAQAIFDFFHDIFNRLRETTQGKT